MKYTTRQIEEAAHKLRALPAKKRTRNTRTAVQMLQAEFAALLERGWSLEQAGRALHKAGIEVSALTVLASLGSASGPPKKRAARKKLAEPPPDEPGLARRSAEPAAAPTPLLAQPTANIAKPPLAPLPRPLAPSLAAPEPGSRGVLPPPLPPMARTPPPLPPLPPFQLAPRAATPPPPPPAPNRVFKRGNLTLPRAAFQVRPDTPDSEL